MTKFRVYNARKRQAGGDCAENYFMQTESIAGIRDARCQELMPDVLLWLGITRIDWYTLLLDNFGFSHIITCFFSIRLVKLAICH